MRKLKYFIFPGWSEHSTPWLLTSVKSANSSFIFKDIWRYLGFIFDRELSFWQHINHYTNKALLTVKCMKILGNSMCKLLPYQKHLLYRIYILPITLYSFPLWHYNKAPLLHSFNMLKKMQRQTTIWILETFCTSPTMELEAIASLILIQLHLWKLSSRNQLQIVTLLWT